MTELAHKMQRLLLQRRGMRIERIRHGAAFQAFLPTYECIVDAILREVPAHARQGCFDAFSPAEACYTLYQAVRTEQPKTMVETGAFLGLSAFVCATALRENEADGGTRGRLFSISLDDFYRIEQPLTKAVRSGHRLGLQSYVHFLEGSSTPLTFMQGQGAVAAQRETYARTRLIPDHRESLLHRLVAILGDIDMAFLDGLHYEAHQMTEIAAVLSGLRPSGTLFVDDTLLSSRRADWRSLAGSTLHGDLQLRRLLDFVRCGFRFYHTPWVVDAFRGGELASVTVFRTPQRFLRMIKLQRNADYASPHGRLATWYAPESLEEFLDKYELRLSEAASVSNGH